MRAPRSSLGLGSLLVTVLIVLTLAAAGPSARAQDPSGDDVCALLTSEAVGEALGTAVTAEGYADEWVATCTWTPTDPDAFAFMAAEWASGTADETRGAFPEAVELSVAGRPAWYEFGVLSIALDAGVLTLYGAPQDGDDQAVLTGLGELAVPRSGSLPTPRAFDASGDVADGQPEVVPSAQPDLTLESLFPETIGGEALVVQSLAGEQAISDPEDQVAVAEALGTLGKTLDDLSAAYGSSEAGTILALRVAGGEASAFLPLIIETMSGDDAAMTTAQVAGKDVTLVASTPPFYVYPAGEVVWVVYAAEPALTEIFTALP